MSSVAPRAKPPIIRLAPKVSAAAPALTKAIVVAATPNPPTAAPLVKFALV